MRKLVFAAAAAALALGSTAANAAALVVGGTTSVVVPSSGTYGNSFASAVPGTQFTDLYNFTLSTGSLFDASLISFTLGSANNIEFNPATPGCVSCGIFLDGAAFSLNSNGALDVFTLNPTVLTGSPAVHTLSVTGYFVSGPTASYAGTFNANIVPVPEPATWGMMLVGFAGIGMAIRRRGKPALAQLA
jgi:hypothetical protein